MIDLVWLIPELNLCCHPILNVTALQMNNSYAGNDVISNDSHSLRVL